MQNICLNSVTGYSIRFLKLTIALEYYNIISDLKNKYEKRFSQEDSVMIFKLSSSCEVLRFGYARNDEKDFIIITWCKHGLW